MEWRPDKNRPICPQIKEWISVRIACDDLKENEQLHSVRDVAIEIGVNPNTVQKAYEQLKALGLIYSVQGSGWFVGENKEIAIETVNALIKEKTRSYIKDMELLGQTIESTKQYIKEWENE